MNNIWEWIKSHIHLKDLIYWIIIGLLIISLSGSIKSCRSTSDRYENNIHALTDSIAYYQSQNGSLIASKTAFESNIKELKIVNGELYSELQDMKIKLKNVSHASHIEGAIDFGQRDTVCIVKIDTINHSFIQPFDFSNKWRTLNGIVSLNHDSLSMSIDNDKIFFDYTIAIDKDNKLYVKSNNPYVMYNELSGFTIPKQKKKHFSVGPGITIGYDPFLNKKTFSIGVNVSWKAFEF